jgi:hypothetical protein
MRGADVLPNKEEIDDAAADSEEEVEVEVKPWESATAGGADQDKVLRDKVQALLPVLLGTAPIEVQRRGPKTAAQKEKDAKDVKSAPAPTVGTSPLINTGTAPPAAAGASAAAGAAAATTAPRKLAPSSRSVATPPPPPRPPSGNAARLAAARKLQEQNECVYPPPVPKVPVEVLRQRLPDPDTLYLYATHLVKSLSFVEGLVGAV